MFNLQILYVSPKLGANSGNVGGPVVGTVQIDLRYPRTN